MKQEPNDSSTVTRRHRSSKYDGPPFWLNFNATCFSVYVMLVVLTSQIPLFVDQCAGQEEADGPR